MFYCCKNEHRIMTDVWKGYIHFWHVMRRSVRALRACVSLLGSKYGLIMVWFNMTVFSESSDEYTFVDSM